MLLVTCSGCGKKLNVKDDFAGKKIKCPACGLVFTHSPAPAPVENIPLIPVPEPTDAVSNLGKSASPKRPASAKAKAARSAPTDEEDHSRRNLLLVAGLSTVLLFAGGLGGGLYFFSQADEKPADNEPRAENATNSSVSPGPKADKDETAQPGKEVKVEAQLPGNDNDPGVVDARTEEQLLGKWRCQEIGGGTIYEFQKGGTVSVYAASGQGPTQKGTYRIIDEQTIDLAGLTGQNGRLEMLLTDDELELIVPAAKDQPGTTTLHFKRGDKETVVQGKPDNGGVAPPLPPVIGTDPKPPLKNPVPPMGGGRARDLIVGKWNRGNVTYEFTLDGQFLAEGLVAFKGTYQFQDDKTLTISGTPPESVGSMTGLWKVSVTSLSLRLYRPEQQPTRVPLLRRVRTPAKPVVVKVPRPAPGDPLQPVAAREPWPRLKSAPYSKKLQILEELQIDNREPVHCVALSPDGKLLAACWDKVHLWDLTVDPPRERTSFHAHSFLTRSAAFSPDGKLLATGGGNHTVHLWDVSGPLFVDLGELKGHLGRVNAVAFSPDGKLLASGSDDKTVVLWDVTTRPAREAGVLRMIDSLARGVSSLAWASNSKLATAGHGHWQVWDVFRKKVNQSGTLNVSASEMPVAYSPDGKILALGGDNAIKLGTTRAAPVLLGHTAKVRSMAFSLDGKYLASVGEDGLLILWDAATGKRRLVKDAPGRLTGLAFPQVRTDLKTGPDQFVVCGNQNGSVLVLHLGYGLEEVAGTEPKTPPAAEAKSAKEDPAKAETEAARKLKLVKQIVEDSKEERRKQNLTTANDLTKKAKEGFEKLIKDYPGTKAAAAAQEILDKLP
jgi:WD40 repeat protein